jgi:outer membrane protein assembly factor BamB
LADLDGNGSLDVIIGVDAHQYCCEPRASQNGGDLYAFRGDGSIMWRAHQDEIFQSSPAVGDIDSDGRLEVLAGTGTYYSGLGQADGRYMSAWNHDGTLLWRRALPERVPGSPALGDINGDGKLEVVVGALDKKVYALNGASGAILWSTFAEGIFGGGGELYSPVLGDYDGDHLDDVFIALGWEVAVLKGTNGVQYTAKDGPGSTKPSYYTSYSLLGTPALGDLDNDGKLDLVAASGRTNEDRGRVFAWRLPNSTTKASWPMLRRDPAHTATMRVVLPPQMYVPVVNR